jgi:hypothetical protein
MENLYGFRGESSPKMFMQAHSFVYRATGGKVSTLLVESSTLRSVPAPNNP